MRSVILNNTFRRKTHLSRDLNELRKSVIQKKKEKTELKYQEKEYVQRLGKVGTQTLRIIGGTSTSKGDREGTEIHWERTSIISWMLRARGLQKSKNDQQCHLLQRRMRTEATVLDYMKRTVLTGYRG